MITVEQLRELTMIQAEDACLWNTTRFVETAYAQQHLRVLTRAIEGDIDFQTAKNQIVEMMP